MANTETRYDDAGNILTSQPAPSLSPPAQSNITQPEIRGRINLLAANAGLDPKFVGDIVNQESGFNPNAENPKELPGGGHAQGLFQFTPQTAKQYGVSNRFDPNQSIPAGIKFLSDLNKQYGGDKRKIAIHYNAGPGHVNDKFEDLPEETQDYLTKLFGAGASTQSKPEIRYDDHGNVIGTDVSKSPFAPRQLTPQERIAQENRQAELNSPGYKFRSALSPYAQFAPTALGAAGAYAGGLVGMPNVGAGAGAGIGEIIDTLIQKGQMTPEDATKALESVGMGYGVSKAFSVPGMIKRQLTEKPAEKAANLLEQERMKLTGGIPSGQPAAEEAESLGAKIAPVKQEETAAWEDLNKKLDKASHTFDVPNGQEDTGLLDAKGNKIFRPKMNQVTVRMPVRASKDTLDFVNGAVQQYSDLVSKFPNAENVNTLNQLKRVQQAAVTDKNGDTYLPFEELKQLRTQIGQSTQKKLQVQFQSPTSKLNLNREPATLAKMSSKLDSDMQSSLLDEDPSGELLDSYAKARGLTKAQVAGTKFDKAIAYRTNYGNGQTDVEGLINDFANPTGKMANQFTPAQRSSIVNTLNAVRNVSPQYDGALRFSNGQWIFTSMYAARHPVKFAISLGSKDMMEKLIAQPKYARLVSQLPSAPRNSSQAQLITKSLIRGLGAGTPATMIAPSGMRVSAHTDENGNVNPDFQMAAQ